MCDCIEKMNKRLEENNGRLAIALRLSPDMKKMDGCLVVATEKLDKTKRKPVPTVMASYCPFCGIKSGA